jgi:hypothetical protein
LRCLPPAPQIAIKWTGWCFESDATLDPTDLKKPSGRTADYSVEDLLAVLGNDNLTNQQWYQKCHKQHGISERSFRRLKKELIESKRIFLSEIDDTWSAIPKESERALD